MQSGPHSPGSGRVRDTSTAETTTKPRAVMGADGQVGVGHRTSGGQETEREQKRNERVMAETGGEERKKHEG